MLIRMHLKGKMNLKTKACLLKNKSDSMHTKESDNIHLFISDKKLTAQLCLNTVVMVVTL